MSTSEDPFTMPEEGRIIKQDDILYHSPLEGTGALGGVYLK
jgi:hypothetical protein